MSLRGVGVAGDVTIGDAPDGVYQACSVSKQFVAAAVLMLADEGRVDLHQPVDRWLSGTHPQWGSVTLHHLLTHTAGFPHWDFKTPALDPYSQLDHRDRLDMLARTPLVSTPGEKWSYTSPGYVLIGDVSSVPRTCRSTSLPWSDSCGRSA